jgi:pyruvate dehydrogenase E1 component beta subunit
MASDPSVHLFGEGAEVKVHYDAPAIKRDFADRVHTMPISEDGNTNFAVGASLAGVKPIVDVISSDFLYRTLDSICNTAAKLNFMRPNESPRTIVIRAEFFTGGPTTGQRLESLFTHIPGLRVVIPSTPSDAYELMRNALETPGVTVYFEDREISDEGLEVQRINLGTRATIVTYGVMRQRVDNTDHSCHVIDLKHIYPIDWDAIKYSVERTGKLLIIEPDIQYGGVGAEIAARIAEDMPNVRIKRLGAKRMTAPASGSLHKSILPTDEEVKNAIVSLTNWSASALARGDNAAGTPA